MAKTDEISYRECKECDCQTPHTKFRPGDRPGFYWKCLYCGHSDIDGEGNEPALV
jgi:hypothetical protein